MFSKSSFIFPMSTLSLPLHKSVLKFLASFIDQKLLNIFSLLAPDSSYLWPLPVLPFDIFGKSRWLLFLISVSQYGWKALEKGSLQIIWLFKLKFSQQGWWGKHRQLVLGAEQQGSERDWFQEVTTWLLGLGLRKPKVALAPPLRMARQACLVFHQSRWSL